MESFNCLVLFLLIISLSITGICGDCQNTIGSLASYLPKHTDQFYYQMQITDIQKKTTHQLVEYYNGKENQGLIEVHGTKKSLIYYNTAKHVVKTVLPKEGKCTVMKVNSAEDFAIPRPDSSITSGVAAIFLQRSKLKESCIGVTMVRGIRCYQWRSTYDDNGIHFEMDWYIADPDWISTFDKPLVRYHVTGNTTGKLAGSSFEYYYDFFQFRRNLDGLDNIFEMPPGVLCDGAATKLMPVISNIFSAYMVYYDENTKNLVSVKQSFDRNFRLSKKTYDKPTEKSDSSNSFDVIINDFNENVAYNIDTTSGTCQITGTEKDMSDNPNSVHHQKMASSEHLFGLNSKNLTYQGVRTIRDMKCDTWIGRINSTYMKNYISEIYFSKIKSIEKGTAKDGQLVGFSAFSTAANELQAAVSFDLFGFTEEESSFEQYDVRPCFLKKMLPVSLSVKGKYKPFIDLNTAQFKLRVTTALMDVMKLSPLRIQDLQIEDALDGYILNFFVTEHVNFNGGNVKRTPLVDALKYLSASLKKNELKVLVGSKFTGTSTTIPLEGSVNVTVNTPLTYSKGAMAGLGVGMCLLGLLLTALIVKVKN